MNKVGQGAQGEGCEGRRVAGESWRRISRRFLAGAKTLDPGSDSMV
jgi:hypothetical protein